MSCHKETDIPLEKLILILVVVIGAAAVTVWGATALLAGFGFSPVAGMAMLSALTLGAYIVFRVVSERLNNKDDDYYDGMEN